MRPIENYNKELKKKSKAYNLQLNNFITKMNDLIEIQQFFHNDMEKNQEKLFDKNPHPENNQNDFYSIFRNSTKSSSRIKINK